jgi:hypothetical protein
MSHTESVLRHLAELACRLLAIQSRLNEILQNRPPPTRFGKLLHIIFAARQCKNLTRCKPANLTRASVVI